MSLLEDLEVAYKLLNEIESLYNVNIAGMQACEQEEVDLKHALELQDLSYHEYAKLSKALREVLQRRRVFKDALEVIEPLRTLMQERESTAFKNKLSAALGATRKMQQYHRTRSYTQRTKVLDNTGLSKKEASP